MGNNSVSQLIRENRFMGNLVGKSQALIKDRLFKTSDNLSLNSSEFTPSQFQEGFDNFIEILALAQAQAEASSAQTKSENPMKAGFKDFLDSQSHLSKENNAADTFMILRNHLSGTSKITTVKAGDPAVKVKQANIEGLLQSERFGNLLGHHRGSALRKNVKALASEELENNLKNDRRNLKPLKILTTTEADNLAYGLFSPYRGGASSELNQASLDDDAYWFEDPLNQPYSELLEMAEKNIKTPSRKNLMASSSESEVLAAQKLAASKTAKNALSREDLDKLVDKVASALDIDPNLVKAVIKTESNFNHKAVSSAGAKGLMQLMPGTAKDLGVKDPFNPVENVWGGARYLKQMLDRHGGNLNNALASYNWGPGNFAKKGKARMPSETRNYITTVNRHYAKFKEV